ncbi:MAG TPA: hypothetical protein VMP13_05320 [Acidimicrobiia bacterium]|nr:hypothetical protein [Acidimicrobiia bacterium]
MTNAQMPIHDLSSKALQAVQLPGDVSRGSSPLTQPCSYGFELSLLFSETYPLAKIVRDGTEFLFDSLDALEEIVQVYNGTGGILIHSQPLGGSPSEWRDLIRGIHGTDLRAIGVEVAWGPWRADRPRSQAVEAFR